MKKFFILIFLFTICACSVDDSTPFDGDGITDQTTTDNEKQDEFLPSNDDQPDIAVDNEIDDLVDDLIIDDEDTVDDDQIVLEGVSGLTVTDTIDSITLSWTNPVAEGLESIVIRLDSIQYPQSVNDGTEVYNGIAETYLESTVKAGEKYYYSVFACYGNQGCSDPAYVSAQPCYSQLDVVFVMDVSTTMSNILSELEGEIGLVWDFVAGKFPDETPHFGLTVFVDDVLMTNSGQPFGAVGDIKTEFNKWYTHTSTNEQTQSTASNLDWPENSLDALAVSATDFNWRNSAETLRIVIHATDDTFLEKPDKFDSNIAAEHTYDETVALLVQEKVRVGAFAAKIGGSTGTTNVEPGFFTDYNSRPSIPEATGGEVYFIEDVKDGTIHMYDSVNTFIENVMCRSYDDK